MSSDGAAEVVAGHRAGDPDAAGELAWIPGGSFAMGSGVHYPEEGPVRTVEVDGFWMDRYQVTNGRFSTFVADTGYVTVAERPLDPEQFPGAPPENLQPGSLVFTMTPGPVDLRHINQWWTWTPGASWRAPEGPGSTARRRENEPVVHVAHEDAQAYAAWADRQLPTEAQWERAARGGLEGAAYVWGDAPEASGERLANYWHGEFPWRHDDEYGTRLPVGSFPPNGYGLFDMAGNVWEWTADWYAPDRGLEDSCCAPLNPKGARAQDSYDPHQPQFRIPRRVVKGGSYLCADSYCLRYRPAARRPQMIDTGMSHIGFRCVLGGAAGAQTSSM